MQLIPEEADCFRLHLLCMQCCQRIPIKNVLPLLCTYAGAYVQKGAKNSRKQQYSCFFRCLLLVLLTSNSPVCFTDSNCSCVNLLRSPLAVKAMAFISSKLGSTNKSLILRVFFLIEEVLPGRRFRSRPRYLWLNQFPPYMGSILPC